MERLTNRDKKPISLTPQNGIRWMAIYHKLKQYEDAEENGLLVRLPCKVGETIWVIGVMGNPQAEPFEVICMTYRIDEQEDNGVCVHAVGNGRISFFLNDELGKSVFLTKEEAEAKLKEMEDENADSD